MHLYLLSCFSVSGRYGMECTRAASHYVIKLSTDLVYRYLVPSTYCDCTREIYDCIAIYPESGFSRKCHCVLKFHLLHKSSLTSQ